MKRRNARHTARRLSPREVRALSAMLTWNEEA